jgi:hypothetical protein
MVKMKWSLRFRSCMHSRHRSCSSSRRTCIRTYHTAATQDQHSAAQESSTAEYAQANTSHASSAVSAEPCSAAADKTIMVRPVIHDQPCLTPCHTFESRQGHCISLRVRYFHPIHCCAVVPTFSSCFSCCLASPTISSPLGPRLNRPGTSAHSSCSSKVQHAQHKTSIPKAQFALKHQKAAH